MDTIFINYKDSKRSDPPIVLVSLSDETNLKKNDNNVALSNLSVYYMW